MKRTAVVSACATLALVGACLSTPEAPNGASVASCEAPPEVELSVVRELDLSAADIMAIGAVQADHHGGLWVLDPTTPQVVRFDSTGRVVARIAAAGPAPWELKAPQAIAVDSSGAVWVLDAPGARMSLYAADGAYVRTRDTRAAIGAVSAAVSGDRVLISQRLFAGSDGVASGAFVRVVDTRDSASSEVAWDSAPPARTASAPFYGAPLQEAIVAARPGGGAVVTYPISYRLRYFTESGGLEHEVIGCEGGNTNRANLREASVEHGMRFNTFASSLQFDVDGLLTVVSMTADSGFHRVDEYDAQGHRTRSARVASASRGGRFISALVPTGLTAHYWAVNSIDTRIARVTVAWPEPTPERRSR